MSGSKAESRDCPGTGFPLFFFRKSVHLRAESQVQGCVTVITVTMGGEGGGLGGVTLISLFIIKNGLLAVFGQTCL